MPIRRQRKTKIIATLGPSSDTPEMIEALFRAGADVFRLNMSHGSREGKVKFIQMIRAVEQKVQRPIAIMADLQGPKLRIGSFKGGEVELTEGARFSLDLKETPGDKSRVSLPHAEIFKVLKNGARVLLDDGKIALEVEAASEKRADCRVVVGGTLSDRKGVNLPDAILPVSAMTKKDHSDLDFLMGEDIDWVALSFVQRADDIHEAKKIVKGRAGVLAKIEKPAAFTCLPEILDAADAVMVARGDLGVEAPVEEVPSMQKRIIRLARDAGKPVIVATQMLETMIHAPVPTRAEVSDVAGAVDEGADAIMLSAESAVGQHPVKAIEVMDRVARQTEGDEDYYATSRLDGSGANPTAEDAITAAASQVGQTVAASAIITFTTSGSTALRAARERPKPPILALTPRLEVARKLCLVWGLHTVKTTDVADFEEMVAKARRMALRQELAKAGERIVITAGVPFGTPGATNVLHIAWVSGDELDGHE